MRLCEQIKVSEVNSWLGFYCIWLCICGCCFDLGWCASALSKLNNL